MRRSLKRFIHECVLSTTHRRGFPLFCRLSRASSLLHLMWGAKSNRFSVSRTSLKSYPLSRHMPCCFSSVGAGLCAAIFKSVSSRILKSFLFALSMTHERGTPRASVSRLLFTPCFARSVGLGPLFFPRKRCFRHCSVHREKTPIDPFHLVISHEASSPEFPEHPGFDPLLKSPVGSARRADACFVQGIPLTSCFQYKKYPVHDLSVGNPWSMTSERMCDFLFRHYCLDLLPQAVRDDEIPSNHPPFCCFHPLRVSPIGICTKKGMGGWKSSFRNEKGHS